MNSYEIKDVDTDEVLSRFLEISPKNQFKYDNGIRLKEKIIITLREYLAIMRAGYVVKSIKTNRPDVNKLEKKQGITETLFMGDDLPNLCVSVYYKDDGVVEIRVTDGGHRTRSFEEFVEDKFILSKKAFFTNNFGKETTLHSMSAKDIRETHPEAWENFLNEELTFTVYHNSTPNQDARETQNRNKGSNHNSQEQRNTLDENVVSEFVRNSCRVVEEENNTPHRLFQNNLIGYSPGRLAYDETLTRFMLMIECKDPSISIDDEKMDKLFEDGSIQDRGRLYVKENDFNAIVKDTNKLLDTIAKIFDVYPTGLKLAQSKRDKTTFTALTRFLLKIESELFPLQQDMVIVDYKKFANSFVDILETIYSDKATIADWVGAGEDTKAKAFGKYLGQFNVVKKTNWTIKWMMDEFADRYKDFGIMRVDKRVSFRPEDIFERYVEVGKCCEACGASIEQKDAQGDHDIPRSWGVEAGGVTEPSNLRILCATDNNKKSNKYTFEYYVDSLKNAA
jgi:5-methylcytosine-specific restriction endonuclease McrA